MLWTRAWRETRVRFLISFGGIFFLSALNVFHGERQAEPWAPRSYYNHVMSEGHILLVVMWVLAVTLLMMGGLLREEAIGSASFTLGLPVSRLRLMAVRIHVGVLQALSLAVVPWCGMYLIACFAGKAYPASQATFYLLLLVAGGSVFFAIALLLSSVMGGEYTAPVVSLGILLTAATLLSSHKTRMFNPLAFMMGTERFDYQSNLLVGPFPWVEALIWLSLAGLLTWMAVRVIERRDF